MDAKTTDGRRLRAVGYVRVSQSRPEMISPEIQEQHIRDHCIRRGYTYLGSIQDLDASGRSFAKRPGLNRAIAMVAAGETDIVVVWKWSRFSRNADEAEDYLHVIETVLGGSVESASEPTGSSAREIHLQLAEFEFGRTSEMWRDAHDRRRRQGLPHSGTPRLGYRMVRTGGDSNYVPDWCEVDAAPAPALALAKCYADYVAGAGFASLAARLNAQGLRTTRGATFTSMSLRATMDSGFAAGLLAVNLRGHAQGGREFLCGKHEAIIDQGTWQAYQLERERRRSRAHRARSPEATVLAGIAYCPYCGGRLAARRLTYKRASGRRVFRSYACAASGNGRGCAGTSMGTEQLDDAVFAWVEDVARASSTSRHDLNAASAAVDQQIEANKRALAEVAGVAETAATLRETRTWLQAVQRDLADAKEQLDVWVSGHIDREDVNAVNRSLRMIVRRVLVARGRPGVRTCAEDRLTIEPVWEPAGDAAPAASDSIPDRRPQPRPGETEVRLLARLEAGTPLTAAELAEHLQLTAIAVRRQLARLCDRGDVCVSGAGPAGRGRPPRLYTRTSPQGSAVTKAGTSLPLQQQ